MTVVGENQLSDARAIAEFARTLISPQGGTPQVRLGVCTSAGTDGTATIALGGTTLPVAGVRCLSHVRPGPRDVCVMIKVEGDLWVVGTIGGGLGVVTNGFKEFTSASGGATSTPLPWSGSDIAVTLQPNRMYRLSGFSSTVLGGSLLAGSEPTLSVARIDSGPTYVILGSSRCNVNAAGQNNGGAHPIKILNNITPGAYSFCLTVHSNASGTAAFHASSTEPAHIMLEDIGAAFA